MIKRTLIIVCAIILVASCEREYGIKEPEEPPFVVAHPLHGKWSLIRGVGDVYRFNFDKGEFIWAIHGETNQMDVNILIDTVRDYIPIMFLDDVSMRDNVNYRAFYYATKYTYTIDKDTLRIRHGDWSQDLYYKIFTNDSTDQYPFSTYLRLVTTHDLHVHYQCCAKWYYLVRE